MDAQRIAVDAVVALTGCDRDAAIAFIRRLYLAGVIASGNDANRLFIENARGHGELIVRHLLAARKAKRSGVTPAA